MAVRAPRESVLERECRRLAQARGCKLIKNRGGEVGFPDRSLLIPMNDLYTRKAETVYVEFKRSRSAKRRPAQEHWIDLLQQAGFRARFIDTIEDFEHLLPVDIANTSVRF